MVRRHSTNGVFDLFDAWLRNAAWATRVVVTVWAEFFVLPHSRTHLPNSLRSVPTFPLSLFMRHSVSGRLGGERNAFGAMVHAEFQIFNWIISNWHHVLNVRRAIFFRLRYGLAGAHEKGENTALHSSSVVCVPFDKLLKLLCASWIIVNNVYNSMHCQYQLCYRFKPYQFRLGMLYDGYVDVRLIGRQICLMSRVQVCAWWGRRELAWI